MGLLQKAAETYDAHRNLVGVSIEKQETLAPIGHLMTKADIEIELDGQGNFMNAHAVSKEEPKIPIPATESSGGRTSKPVPHPLCDQLKYLAPFGGEAYSLYLEQLEKWNNSDFSHPKLAPILTYVKKGCILQDLAEAGIIKLKDNGEPVSEKLLVRWRVTLHDEKVNACWMDTELFDAFSKWYLHQRNEGEKSFCMVSGEVTSIAEQHPKGVVALKGNAKLISANDASGFTFRGRFSEEWQASTVGYEVSQKAHNALRWVVANQGKYYGGRLFLCWNPQGIPVQNPASAFLPSTEVCVDPSDYQDKLENTLLSGKKAARLTGTGTEATAVYAVFDAATTGRLAVTDYHEFLLSEYLQRLYQWDSLCCWENGPYGIQSPPLPQLVNNAFGTQRENNGRMRMETDDRIFRTQLQRLIDSRLSNGQHIPADIVRILVNRASSPQSYDRSCWLSILFTACAVVRKYRYDQFKEEWNVTLDEEKQNTSYLFGRLLAIAEKVERDTFGDGESREPNAIRMQAVFSRRPLATWRILQEKLIPYFARLTPGVRRYYRSMIQEIVAMLDESKEDLTRPLEDTYLLGYYSQRKALYTSKKENDKED